MEILSITKYNYNGKEYNSLLEIKEEIHNTIGIELLDLINKKCPLQKHRDYETLLNILCSPNIRNVLLKTLNVTFKEYDEFTEEYDTINILDLKK